MNSSSTIRSFIQDFLNPKLSIREVIKRWNGVQGIYEAVKSNRPALRMFNIQVQDEASPEIFLCLSNQKQREKQHNNLGLFVYPGDKVTI